MRKLLLFVLGMMVVITTAMAQKGLNIGLHAAGGQVFSRNVAIPKESPYYIKNNAGLMYGGGLDIAFGFDDYTALQTGVSYNSREFNLTPTDSLGGTYDELTTTKGVISIPIAIRQRFALNESKKLFANILLGQSLDIVKFDSTATFGPATLAGQPYSRREVVYPKKIIPTVLLGAGLDFQSNRGNALNVSIVWGLSPYKMVKGDIKEFDALVNDFDPATDPDADADPEQFPSYYYDYAIRGSYVALQLHYWFNLKFKKKTVEEGEGGATE